MDGISGMGIECALAGWLAGLAYALAPHFASFTLPSVPMQYLYEITILGFKNLLSKL